MRLIDHAADVYSQFGEDGIIEKIFEMVGARWKTCCEFGAADGLSCSNTAHLWKDLGWAAFLVESDDERFRQLEENTADYDTEILHHHVATSGDDAIDHILPPRFQHSLDYMSIDIDGDDWEVFERLTHVRPRVVSVEYNQSIPPPHKIRQACRGDSLGASAAVLDEIAQKKDYVLVAMTRTNMFFVVREEASFFDVYEKELTALYDWSLVTYLSTDNQGRPFLVGAAPPWGLRHTPYVRPTEGDYALAPTSRDSLIAAWEDAYGKALVVPVNWSFNIADRETAAPVLANLFSTNCNLILLDVEQVGDEARIDWIPKQAKIYGYQIWRSHTLVAAVRQDLVKRPVV